MNRADTIAEIVLSTKATMARYLAGFDDTNRTRQAPHLPNHAAWSLGHLALTMHRACELIKPGHAFPLAEFIEGGTKSGGGDANRFATESVNFGSQPVDSPSQYPGLARSIEIFNNAVDSVAACVRAVPDASLDENVTWGGSMQIARYLLAGRMAVHNGAHIGQIADLRRALGFKSIFA